MKFTCAEYDRHEREAAQLGYDAGRAGERPLLVDVEAAHGNFAEDFLFGFRRGADARLAAIEAEKCRAVQA